MSTDTSVKLIFEYPFDDHQAFEAESRGCLDHVCVEIRGARYPVSFYDPGRLRQDLEEMTKHGQPFIAELGMIVVPAVTLENMYNAVRMLNKVGFFAGLVPLPALAEGS